VPGLNFKNSAPSASDSLKFSTPQPGKRFFPKGPMPFANLFFRRVVEKT
jgi:hypothetical protein